jgi:predicted AAA+ superfamily ATPase
MEEGRLLEVMSDWNFWGKSRLEVGVPRPAYTDKILGLLEGNNVIVEAGIRRCGKSYIARQVAWALMQRGRDRRSVLVINLEDERLPEKEAGLLQAAYSLYKRELKPKGKPLVILDEAQEAPGWERFVRGMSERGEAAFIVTGSSSALLSSEYSTLLSGRHIAINITPLSFAEFLRFTGVRAGSRLEMARNAERILAALDEYLRYGGFPAVVLSKNKEELLLSYFDTILIKDVSQRYAIREQEKLRFLTKYYLTNVASHATYNSISRSTRAGGGRGMPVKTIQRFSEYLASASLLFFTRRFSFSVKEQENSPRKIYSIDNGFSTILGFNFMEIKGRMMENSVAIELLRRSHMDRNLEFYYWKSPTSGREVDFLVKPGGKAPLLPIQVSYSIDERATREREVSALIECMRALDLKEGLVLTYDRDGKEEIDGFIINYRSLPRWLLNF